MGIRKKEATGKSLTSFLLPCGCNTLSFIQFTMVLRDSGLKNIWTVECSKSIKHFIHF